MAGEEFGEESGRRGALEVGVGFEILAEGGGHGAGVDFEKDFAVVSRRWSGGRGRHGGGRGWGFGLALAAWLDSGGADCAGGRAMVDVFHVPDRGDGKLVHAALDCEAALVR